MFWFFAAGAFAGAFWGLVAAFVLRWVRKSPKMPTWPIVTGLLLGLAFGLAQVVRWAS